MGMAAAATPAMRMKERRETAGVIRDAVIWSSLASQDADAGTESDTIQKRFKRAEALLFEQQ
jgi:hypothetical protein